MVSPQIRRPVLHTCDFGLKRASSDVVGAAIFDSDDVVSRGHWCVVHFKPFGTLLTLHLHLRRALDSDGQRSRSSFGVIDDKFGLVTCQRRMQDDEPFHDIYNNLISCFPSVKFDSRHNDCLESQHCYVFLSTVNFIHGNH